MIDLWKHLGDLMTCGCPRDQGRRREYYLVQLFMKDSFHCCVQLALWESLRLKMVLPVRWSCGLDSAHSPAARDYDSGFTFNTVTFSGMWIH